MPRAAILAIESAAILGVIAFGFLIAFPATRLVASNLLVSELGPVELSTFGCFLGAAFLFGRLAWNSSRRGERGTAVRFPGGLAVFCLLLAMEEVSWGQSLFPYPTPSIVEAVNQQGEFNLHNLAGLQGLSSLFVLALGVAGVIGTLRDASQRRRPFGVPGVLTPLLGVVVIMGAVETFNDFWSLPIPLAAGIGKLSEAVEMCAGLACLLTAWLHHRRAQHSWRAEDAAESSAVERVAA